MNDHETALLQKLEAANKKIAELKNTVQRYSQAPNIPYIKGGTCNTTHSACDCVIEQLTKANGEIAELKEKLEQKQFALNANRIANNAYEVENRRITEVNLLYARFVHDIKMECHSCEYNEDGPCYDDCHGDRARQLCDKIETITENGSDV